MSESTVRFLKYIKGNPVQFAAECEGAGIPPQYHPGLLLRLGGICANGIGHGPKKDDVRSATRVSTRTAVVEYRL